MAEPVYDIPPDRKLMYYGGMALAAVGFLMFLSNFLVIGAGFSESEPDFGPSFDSHRASMGSMMARALGGMLLMGAGSMLMRVGAAGWAGAGVKLDPRQARKDREPWNRAAGGMLNDALEEVDVLKRPTAEPAVKVRCRACSALNDEAAKFCNQCGKLV